MRHKIASILPFLFGVLLAGCETNPVNSAVPARTTAAQAPPGWQNVPQPAYSAKLNSIRIGMTKAEVQSILGTPDSTSAQANAEYLTYYLESESGYAQPYVVRLISGKVESFGRFAELLDLYNRPVGTVSPGTNAGLVSELVRLKALRDQGVLTDEEFQKAKAKLLSQP